MATSAITQSLPDATGAAHTFRIFRKETKYEFLKLMRTKSFSFSTIGFPVMFYILFGIANRNATAGNIHIAKYMLGGYACFGLIGAALFGIGVGLAGELAAGWLELKRASPMPAPAYLFAKCASAVAFGLIIVSILTTIATTFGGVSLTSIELVKMLGMTIVGSISFASMGLLLALLVPANAAPGHRQSHLPADVLPQRPLDASALHAALAARHRTRPADLSSLSTHAQHLRLRRLHVPRHPLERTHRLHLADAWSQLAHLPSQRTERLTRYTFGSIIEQQP